MRKKQSYPSDTPDPPPTVLLVMAEYGVDDPVWNRSPGGYGPVSLSDLGVSDSLVLRLREWNATFERRLRTDGPEMDPETVDAWIQLGLHLAYDLQWELPDIDVRYAHTDDDGPLRG